jgi:hypothetical protein
MPKHGIVPARTARAKDRARAADNNNHANYENRHDGAAPFPRMRTVSLAVATRNTWPQQTRQAITPPGHGKQAPIATPRP